MTRYIGKQPAFGNFVKLDAISVVNGQAAYTMQSGSSNFTNYDNVNQFIVSLNGVIQAPTDSFTVSGSTITFASALSTGDVINFILVLGDVLSVGTPSDNTVSTVKIQNTAVNADKLATDAVQTAKIQNDAVTTDKINLISTSSTPSLEAKGTSGQTDGYIQLNCEQNTHGIKLKSPPHSAGQSYTLTFPSTAPATDKFLQTNSSGVLSFADAGGGAYELISTTTLSSTTHVDFTSLSSTYQDFKFIGSGIVHSTDTQSLACRFFDTNGLLLSFNTVSGVSSNSPHYDFTQFGHDDDSFTQDSQNQTRIDLGQNLGAGTNEAYNFEVDLFNPHLTGVRTIVHSKVVYIPGDGYAGAVQFSQGFNTSSESGDHSRSGIRFFPTGGNFASGKISFYGRKA